MFHKYIPKTIFSRMIDDKTKKEFRFSNSSIIEYKELEDSLIVKGYIATTHFDGQDKLTVSALKKWEKEINEGNPRANKVSVNHNRKPHVAGVGIKDTAKVEKFNDGEYGLYAETLVDKTREDYADIKYRVENNLLDSFSIEYIASEEPNYQGDIRILDESTELHGWTLASQPMNENAVMIKEVLKMEKKEEVKPEEPVKELKEVVSEVKEEVKMEETISKEDKELLEKAKLQVKEQEMEEKMLKILRSDKLRSELEKKEDIHKPLQNKEEDEEIKVETPEEKERKALSKEYKSVICNKELNIKNKFEQVGLIAEKEGLFWANGDSLEYKKSNSKKPEFKEFMTNGSKLEFKSLGITTNQNTDTDYLLSSAELRDLFDPVIYDAINSSTLTWGVLQKDDYSQKGNNLCQFVLRTAANATAEHYTGNGVATSQGTRQKYQTKFKKVQVGISVDGDMVAAAKGGPVGDVFGLEVMWGTEDMLTVVNSALYAEVGLETAAGPIGFEYITDSDGNTTMYNITRSGTMLETATASDTYIDGSSTRISIDNLRIAIEQALTEGAQLGNLVFFTHPTQERLFKGIFDAAMLYTMLVNPRFGFEGKIHFEGVPIFADKDCNTDDWFLVDLESHRVAIWVPPTLEMLGKRADADEGFIKMYYCTYNTCPRRMVQIYGNATS